jgi:hypothetical protein
MDRSTDGWRDLGTIVEGTSPKVMARCVDAVGDLIEQASLTNVKLKLYDITTGQSTATLVGSEVTLTLDDVWFDTAQTDDGWTSNLGGYNFAYVIPAASLAGGGAGVKKLYQIEIRGTLSAGTAFWVVKARIAVTDALGIT